MKHLNIPIIFNGILTFAMTFLALLVILSLLPMSATWKIVISLLVAACCMVASVLLQKDRFLAKKENLLKDKELSAKLRFLNTCAYDVSQEIFSSYFCNMGIQTYVKGQYMNISDSYCLFLGLYPDEIQQNTVKDIINGNPFPSTKLGIISNSFSQSALDLATARGVDLIPSIIPLKELSDKNLVPKTDVKVSTKGLKLKSLFSRKSGKKFILYGFALYLFSTFAFYPVYYVISGSIFVVYGLIALFLSKSPQTTGTDKDFLSILDLH